MDQARPTDPVLKESDYYILIAFLTMMAPVAQLVFRAADNNRLTSWQWTFAKVDPASYFTLIFIGIVVAFVLSRLKLNRFQPLLLFIFSFSAAAAFWEIPEVIVDSARYFAQAKYLKINGISYFLTEWGNEIFAWTDLPLIPFIYGLILKFAGEERIFIQIFTTMLFAGAVVSTYLIGKELWGAETGFIAGLLLLGFPYLLTQVPLMLVDVPTMFFLTLAILAFTLAMSRGGTAMIMLSAAALFLAFSVKYSTWALLSVFIVILICYMISSPLLALKRGIFIGLVALILMAIFFYFQHEVIVEQMALLISYQKPGLKRWSESLVSTFLFQTHPFITISAILAALVAIKKRDLKFLIVSYLVLLLVFILQVKRIRYTLPLFPMLALMASYGLREISSQRIKRFLVFCIINTSLVTAFWAFRPFLQNMEAENLKNAGRFLNAIKAEHIEVFTLPQEKNVVNPAVSVPLLDLFTKGEIIYRGKRDPDIKLADFNSAPLRFTWEYDNPQYYQNIVQETAADALVIISARPDQPLPDHLLEKSKKFSHSRGFNRATWVFDYKTFVSLYYNQPL